MDLSVHVYRFKLYLKCQNNLYFNKRVLFGLYLVLVILDFGMSRKYQDVYLINVGRTEINVGRTEIHVGRTE